MFTILFVAAVVDAAAAAVVVIVIVVVVGGGDGGAAAASTGDTDAESVFCQNGNEKLKWNTSTYRANNRYGAHDANKAHKENVNANGCRMWSR